jgi:hypothetical protein
VRAANPQTYTTYCSYSEERIESNEATGKHTKACGNLGCDYYQRILGARAVFAGDFAALGGGGALTISAISVLYAPATGGLSLLFGLSWPFILTGTFAGTFLGLVKAAEIADAVENELKEKWEAEQRNIRAEEQVGESSRSQNAKLLDDKKKKK